MQVGPIASQRDPRTHHFSRRAKPPPDVIKGRARGTGVERRA